MQKGSNSVSVFSVGCVVLMYAAVRLSAAQGGSADTPPKPPVFDVTSVKVQQELPLGPSMNVRESGLRARSKSLKELIAYTYKFSPERIIGGPRWLESNRYEIIGRTNQSGATMAIVNETISGHRDSSASRRRRRNPTSMWSDGLTVSFMRINRRLPASGTVTSSIWRCSTSSPIASS
jgi:Protein of unknown function (DUF3738)